MRPLEYCCECDVATGNAGQGDGSFYTESGEGPFCGECWEKRPKDELSEAEAP